MRTIMSSILYKYNEGYLQQVIVYYHLNLFFLIILKYYIITRENKLNSIQTTRNIGNNIKF